MNFVTYCKICRLITNRFTWFKERSRYWNSFYESQSYAAPYLIYLKKRLVFLNELFGLYVYLNYVH